MISPRPKRRCVTINGRQGQPDSWRHVCFYFVLCFKITGELVDCERLHFPCFNPSWASFWHVPILESDKAEQIFNSKTSWCCSLKEKPKSRTPALHDGVPFSALWWTFGRQRAQPGPWGWQNLAPTVNWHQRAGRQGRSRPWHGQCRILSIFAFHFITFFEKVIVLICFDP